MDLTDIGTVRGLLEKYGFGFSKNLGQNFIVNPAVCPRIAEESGAGRGVGVLEIGAGIGTLTAELAKLAEKVVTVEIDSRLIPVLGETLSGYDNITVYNEDIMKCDIPRMIGEDLAGLKVIVCANLPYYITSPLIMKLLEDRLPIDSVTVMVQKEAARRLCADVGTREAGAVTVAVNYYGCAEYLFGVTRGNFMPQPNVDSSVIRIDVSKNSRLSPEDEEFFFRVVKSGFSQRRKTAANAVSSGMCIDKGLIYDALSATSLPMNVRLEQLDMDTLISFSDHLKNLIKTEK